MPTAKTTKTLLQKKNTDQQDDGGAAAKDGDVQQQELTLQLLVAETTAVMKEKMTLISNKLDIITAKLESESRRNGCDSVSTIYKL